MTIVAVAVAGTAAYAYWTAGGSGSGSGTAGSTVGLIPRQTTTLAPMKITVLRRERIKVPAGTCDATDFTLATPVMNVGAQVPAGTGKGSFTGATIHFNNKAAVNRTRARTRRSP